MIRATQKGFSLVTAIFLLVVVAGLLGYMVNMSVVQHSTVAMSVRGAQAMQAARSALDYAIYRLLVSNAVCIDATGAASSIDTTTVAFGAAEPALQPFTVDLNCAQSTHREGTVDVIVYELTATASSGVYILGGRANPDYVSRRIRATVSNPPP
jgi:MSHA biogenesis protein MshP